MSKRWYKRCGADFVTGNLSLTLEEKGAYSLCLDLIYDKCEPIPDDARWLSGICGVSLRKWASLRQRLIDADKIYITEDGKISNRRADFELASSGLSPRNLAEAGAKGGRRRAENARLATENSNLAQASLEPRLQADKRREEREEEEASASSARARKPDWIDEHAELVRARADQRRSADPPPAQPSDPRTAAVCREVMALARMTGPPPDADLIAGWLAAGANPETDIYPTVARIAAKGSTSRFARFDAAIREAVGNRTAADDAWEAGLNARMARLAAVDAEQRAEFQRRKEEDERFRAENPEDQLDLANEAQAAFGLPPLKSSRARA